jgi:hypothetical protein
MTKLTVAFHDFANSLTKKVHILEVHYVLKHALRPNPEGGGGGGGEEEEKVEVIEAYRQTRLSGSAFHELYNFAQAIRQRK